MAKKKEEKASVAKPEPDAPKRPGSQSNLLIAVGALAIGGLAGWFGRDARSDDSPAAKSAEKDPAPASSGACAAWADEVCKDSEPDACVDVKAATELMPESACAAAKGDVKATLEKLSKRVPKCDQVVAKVCADFGEDSESCGMIRTEAPAFPKEQCVQMLANYDEVVAELKQMELANAPITAEQAVEQRAGDGPGFGPKDAKLAIVEYSDFECGYCGLASAAVSQLKDKYGEKVRFVFRQFPLSFHENAQLAAEASLEAHAQGKFWPFHDLLFANQDSLDRESLDKYAKEAGLDMAKFKKALDDHTYEDVVAADVKLGDSVGVGGTPTMLIGTARAPNPTEFAEIEAVVEAELAKL